MTKQRGSQTRPQQPINRLHTIQHTQPLKQKMLITLIHKRHIKHIIIIPVSDVTPSFPHILHYVYCIHMPSTSCKHSSHGNRPRTILHVQRPKKSTQHHLANHRNLPSVVPKPRTRHPSTPHHPVCCSSTTHHSNYHTSLENPHPIRNNPSTRLTNRGN